MGMFIVLLGVFAIILTATCSAFGITLPEPEPEKKNKNNVYSSDDESDKYDDEIDDEILGVANHGRGLYKS